MHEESGEGKRGRRKGNDGVWEKLFVGNRGRPNKKIYEGPFAATERVAGVIERRVLIEI